MATLKVADSEHVTVNPLGILSARKRPTLRLPRQLVDYILIVQDKAHLRLALKAHYERLTAYYEAFIAD